MKLNRICLSWDTGLIVDEDWMSMEESNRKGHMIVWFHLVTLIVVQLTVPSHYQPSTLFLKENGPIQGSSNNLLEIGHFPI